MFKLGDRVRIKQDTDLSGHCCGYLESREAGTIYTVDKESMSIGNMGTYFRIRAGNTEFCRTWTDSKHYELVSRKPLVVIRRQQCTKI